MKKISLLLTACVLVATLSCKNDKKETEKVVETETTEIEAPADVETTAEDKKIKIALNAKSGSNVTGNAVFRQENGEVTMIAIMSGLEPGTHAIHLHETADCSSDDGKSTGGHWNPTGQPHGEWGAEAGYHKGDIGNFNADDKGNGTISFTTDQWCIGCGDPAKDILGKAIIVHQGADDFTSQPSGAAGARISCAGVIED
ncbi:superoxide dismutase family protein [Hanstruepera flava]|uniref:superoxide dismutase family protein n=1 Tax=Hanstruepera flava TaxID=2930218 RepID=UPI002028A74B|nr:superoxide dismutase family protein [Hanstruepera flava]